MPTRQVILVACKLTDLRRLLDEPVSWATLRHDRERHVFREAFFLGASFGMDLERDGHSRDLRLLAEMRRAMRREA